MKKIFYYVSAVFQVILLIAAFGIQYFSMKKMGMMRYVLFINHEWEAQYPVAALRNVAIAFLVLLSAVIISYAIIRKGKKVLLMLIAEVIITLSFVFFALAYSAGSYRSYYFTCIILAATALIQDIKILVYLIGQD